MICQFCKAEIPENENVCPQCGSCLTVKPAGCKWKLGLMIAAFVLAIAGLGLLLLQQFGVTLFPKKDSGPPADTAPSEAVKTEEEILGGAGEIVAERGQAKLTNAVLQIFSREEFLAFAQQNINYLSMIGLDYTQPLSGQVCYFAETISWEAYFIDSAMKTWENYVILSTLADADGYSLPEERQEILDKLPETLEKQAVEGNYKNADDMLKELYGPNSSLSAYMEYVTLREKVDSYTAYKRTFTQEQLEAAFPKYEEEFAEDGITKTSHLISDVRHILIEPEGGQTSEDGQTVTYNEQEWKDCLKKAEEILDEWKAGEKTEESFTALAKKHSQDPGVATNEGLYENVAYGSSYVEPFLEWSIDINRKPGDTDIVKTEFGYHIMYFVDGEPEWIYYTWSKLDEEATKALSDKLEQQKASTETKFYQDRIKLGEIYQYNG